MSRRQDFSVKQLAVLAGVSVRTLHLYDQIGLLKPSVRTEAGYRYYSGAELLRLQQILFYKELDFPLKEISDILDDPGFDLVKALRGHKTALSDRRDRLNTLLHTIDTTIENLKNKTMSNFEKLYEGLPRDTAAALRQEAIDKWGEDNILQSEKSLLEMDPQQLENLKADQKDIAERLRTLTGEPPESPRVQEQIARHYTNIRGFWGMNGTKQLTARAYKGLAGLYVSDERYFTTDGKPDPLFAPFMRAAMEYFADAKLK